VHAPLCESGWPASRARRCGAYVVVSTRSAKLAYSREPVASSKERRLIGFAWLETALGWRRPPAGAGRFERRGICGKTLFTHRRFIRTATLSSVGIFPLRSVKGEEPVALTRPATTTPLTHSLMLRNASRRAIHVRWRGIPSLRASRQDDPRTDVRSFLEEPSPARRRLVQPAGAPSILRSPAIIQHRRRAVCWATPTESSASTCV
jgi:hypothetical protein